MKTLSSIIFWFFLENEKTRKKEFGSEILISWEWMCVWGRILCVVSFFLHARNVHSCSSLRSLANTFKWHRCSNIPQTELCRTRNAVFLRFVWKRMTRICRLRIFMRNFCHATSHWHFFERNSRCFSQISNFCFVRNSSKLWTMA